MIRRVIVLLALLAIGGAAFVWYAGARLSAPVQRAIGEVPADLQAVAIEFPSTSGATVRGWWSESREGKGTVVLLPGVRANRLSMVDRARFLRQAGYSVLLVDLQGTGETEGEHITFGWLESRDVLAAVEFARNRRPDEAVAILGSSLGGAAALLATPPLRVDAMILEAVYPTVERAIDNRLRMRFGAVGELGTPLLLAQLRPRLGISPRQLRPVEHVPLISWPVLIIGGEEDRHTTPEDTRLLYERARSPKGLWLIPGAGHVDLHRARTAEYERRVLAFLERALAGSREAEPVHEVGGDVLPPRRIGRCAPEFERTSFERRTVQPLFIYEVIVSSEGRVRSVALTKPTPTGEPYDELEASVRAAIEQCRFEPATLHGEPVAVKMIMTSRIEVR